MKNRNKLINLLRPLFFFKNTSLSSPPSLAPSPQRGEGQSLSPSPAFRIRTWTIRLLSPLSPLCLNLPPSGAYIAICGFLGFLGALSLPVNAVAAGGDYVSNCTVSTRSDLTGVVADRSAPHRLSYWMNQSGEIWSGGNNDPDTDPGEKILNSLDENVDWQYLAKGDVAGSQCFIMFNDSDDLVVIRYATSGVEWGCWTYPDSYPDYVSGLDIDESEILVYNRAAPKRIGRFSLTGTHLDDMFLPYPTIQAGQGMAVNPNDGSIILNLADDSGFYNVTFAGETYSSHETFNYNIGPGGNRVITDISCDPQTNYVLTANNDPDMDQSDLIQWFEGSIPPQPTPEPTPTPTPDVLETKIGIYRPDSGLWAIRGVTRAYFGGDNDLPIYRDFNGDGTDNIGVFRAGSGLWAIKGITRVYFGGSSDEPLPGDYNGDGADDIGIFRPSSGLWAIKGITRTYFGGLNDEAVPSDYDGDGSDDIGIFRPASGLWAIKGVTRAYFGATSDSPQPGDYAGDGSADIGIFRPTSGLWAIRGVTRSYFGGSTDEPVPGDYDGDTTEEIGIFRATSGLWAIKAVTRAYFGGVGDIPVGR